ncbi:MAG: TIGR00730 family Rossman fold protein [Cyclobacteriaceae bacterium]|nr:TIGR00730 family Rossman fold protein [Cyclobacteriaceae bacterium]
MERNICVFCGSSTGNRSDYIGATQKLAKVMVEHRCNLVYGGGSIGLMGILADQVLQLGGKVLGVIPKFLDDREVGHHGLTRLIVTESMHERKQEMASHAEGFIAMPGGIGTLEELFEIFTWIQLKLVKHSLALYNVGGYFDLLIGFLDKMVTEGFLKAETRNLLIVSDDAEEIIKALSSSPFGDRESWKKKV